MGVKLRSLAPGARGMGLVLLGIVASCGRPPGAGLAGSPHGDSASAREYVQGFYDRYLATERTEGGGPAHWRLLGSDVLDSTLVAALREDSAFGDQRHPGSREGLNFDPFLASQDPCPRYEAIRARSEGPGFHVTVRPLCADSSWQNQGPVVEVSYRDARWRIVNVHYERTDLRTLLCQYAGRDTRARRPPAACVR